MSSYSINPFMDPNTWTSWRSPNAAYLGSFMSSVGGKSVAEALEQGLVQLDPSLGKPFGGGVGEDEASKFPEGTLGDISGKNGMFRLNYFNGRFLTAESLRREQVYWDVRARLVANIHPAGVAWGLGLSMPSAKQPPLPAAAKWGRKAQGVLAEAVPADAVGGPAAAAAMTTADSPFAEHDDFAPLCARYKSATTDAARVSVLDGVQKMIDELDLGATTQDFITWCVGGEPEPEPKAPELGKTLGPDDEVVLQPGLAFDDCGRPITVGKPFTFRFADLIDDFVTKPRGVIGGGTQFAPCVCVTPLTPIDQGPAIKPGPYLLVIHPEEVPEDGAKVYGEVCSNEQPSHCEADGWRGAFGLSLLAYPADVPMSLVQTTWDLRGWLSAHYFDVWEHNLAQRWRAPFAADARFCEGTGPFVRTGGPVPLAMVYVGPEGSVLFVDPWTPRRSLTESASASWTSNLRGAPTGAAADARIHQFQCQLSQGLQAASMNATGEAKRPLNLFERGFRHIPPYGFLPVDALAGGFDSIRRKFFAAPNVSAAKKQAEAYFEGTNVLTYTVVAIHDDDIFEDMSNAHEKDPVALRRWTPERRTWSDAFGGDLTGTLRPQASYESAKGFGALGAGMLGAFAGLAGALFKRVGLFTLENLVNREIEVVKLVIPMSGLRRVYPLLGVVDPATGAPPTPAAAGGLVLGEMMARMMATPAAPSAPPAGVAPGAEAAAPAGDLADFPRDEGANPHRFVFYVKQRLVVLDYLYVLLDAALDLMAALSSALSDGKIMKPVRAPSSATAPADAAAPPTEARLEEDLASQPEMLFNSLRPSYERNDDFPFYSTGELANLGGAGAGGAADTLRGAFDDEVFRAIVVEGARAWAPELALGGTWEAFDAMASRTETAAVAAGHDPMEAKRMARHGAIDALLAEHRGMGLVKLAAVALDGTSFETFTGALRTEAKKAPAPVTASGERVERTLSHELFLERELEASRSALASRLDESARRAFGARTLREVVEVDEDVAVGAVLSATRADAERELGAERAAELVTRLENDTKEMDAAVEKLEGSDTFKSRAFWTAYDRAITRTEGDVAKALVSMRRGSDAEVRDVAATLAGAHKVLGERGARTFINDARRIVAP